MTSFAELAHLEPELAELEAEVDRVRDDGSAPFFCSNFVWLPFNSRLRELVGVARPRSREGDPLLWDSRAYEEAFVHLSRRMPPCRDCGCRRFRPYVEAAWERGAPERS